MCFGGGGASSGAAEARADEAARQARITEGRRNINDVFSTFDDNYYNRRQNEYANYAKPQVDSQFKNAQNELLYSLARSGNMASSEMGKQLGTLERERRAAATKVSDASIAYANQARQNVEQARGDVLNQLMATSDPSVAASQANARARLMNNYNPVMDSIGELFGQSMATAANANRAQYYMPNAPGMSAFGIGSKSSGAQKVYS